jgi:hypothetical protein
MASFKKNQSVDIRSKGVPQYISQTKETAHKLAREIGISNKSNRQVAVTKEK